MLGSLASGRGWRTRAKRGPGRWHLEVHGDPARSDRLGKLPFDRGCKPEALDLPSAAEARCGSSIRTTGARHSLEHFVVDPHLDRLAWRPFARGPSRSCDAQPRPGPLANQGPPGLDGSPRHHRESSGGSRRGGPRQRSGPRSAGRPDTAGSGRCSRCRPGVDRRHPPGAAAVRRPDRPRMPERCGEVLRADRASLGKDDVSVALAAANADGERSRLSYSRRPYQTLDGTRTRMPDAASRANIRSPSPGITTSLTHTPGSARGRTRSGPVTTRRSIRRFSPHPTNP